MRRLVSGKCFREYLGYVVLLFGVRTLLFLLFFLEVLVGEFFLLDGDF